MTIATMWPLPGIACNQRFGTNKASHQPDGHTGMDFACPIGTPIRAAAAGTVLYADWAQGLGWPNPYYINPDFTPNDGIDQSAGIVIVIDHGPFVTVYAHCNQTGLNKGDKVALGEIIGQVGSTGFSTGPHLHFEVLPDKWNVLGKWYGRVNPELYIGLAPALKPNERIVGPLGVIGRPEPQRSEINVRTVKGGTTEKFDRWRNGEVISGIGLWYGDGTAWYWAGGFEVQSTDALRDDNPQAPPPVIPVLEYQRVTGEGGAVRRSLPNKNAAPIGDRFGGDLILDFRAYVIGEDPYGDGNNRWFVGKYGAPTYFWSGSFTDPRVGTLPDLTAQIFPPAVINPGGDHVVTPAPLPYTFALDFPTINGISVQLAPAELGNVDVGNFPGKPEKAVCHWWNSLEARPTFDGTVGEFRRAGSLKSAHWVVSYDRIAQMVSLKDRAYHAGPGGNGWVGIEIDPVATERDGNGVYTARALKVQANVRALLSQLRDRLGYKLATTLHKNVPGAATQCSGIDLGTLEIDPPVVVIPSPPVIVTPPVVVPPVVVPPVVLPEMPALFTPEQVRKLMGLADLLKG